MKHSNRTLARRTAEAEIQPIDVDAMSRHLDEGTARRSALIDQAIATADPGKQRQCMDAFLESFEESSECLLKVIADIEHMCRVLSERRAASAQANSVMPASGLEN
ncbi:hypothetical protein TK49_06805 [Ralstonia mannitolilytica]|uniref:hypothetical protein n=1 Tax=Ralstonia mannitolilytica TaxID=105219 RepID=UPI0005DA51C8|nr:hypothetical protein [Ralstonia mannitolilytica]AJW44448.1 hypothetical protein TK49_06805 [Ralstonia mannitolilytica]